MKIPKNEQKDAIDKIRSGNVSLSIDQLPVHHSFSPLNSSWKKRNEYDVRVILGGYVHKNLLDDGPLFFIGYFQRCIWCHSKVRYVMEEYRYRVMGMNEQIYERFEKGRTVGYYCPKCGAKQNYGYGNEWMME